MTAGQIVYKTSLLLSLLLLLPSGHEAAVPSRCFERVKCRDAILLYATRDTTLAECSDLCGDTYAGECETYIWDVKDGHNVCSLYKDCSDTVTCDSCIYGSSMCRLTECFAFDTGCNTSADTIIGTIEGVGSVTSCLKACKEDDTNECSYFEFEETEAGPICTLLKSCENHSYKENAVTGRVDCSEDGYNCFQPYRCVGQEITSMVETASNCFQECINENGCQWFVHYDGVCSLLSDCQKRIPCSDCILGRVDCPPTPLF